MNETYIVFVQIDSNSTITAINSSEFLDDITDWTQIDEGTGDKYHHAQGNYLETGLIDDKGCFNYKLVDGIVSARSEAEKQMDIIPVEAEPTTAEYLLDLDFRLSMIELGL